MRDTACGRTHLPQRAGQAGAHDGGQDEGHHDSDQGRDRHHRQDRLSEHGCAGVGSRAVFGHHRVEAIGPDDHYPKGEDREGNPGNGQGRDRDPGPDSEAAPGHLRSPPGPADAARYPTPRTVAT